MAIKLHVAQIMFWLIALQVIGRFHSFGGKVLLPSSGLLK